MMEEGILQKFEEAEINYVLKVSFDDYENSPWNNEYNVKNIAEAKRKFTSLEKDYPRCSVSAYLVLEKLVDVDINF